MIEKQLSVPTHWSGCPGLSQRTIVEQKGQILPLDRPGAVVDTCCESVCNEEHATAGHRRAGSKIQARTGSMGHPSKKKQNACQDTANMCAAW